MPCVVPNCDPKGQCFALHFPQSYLLSQRWKQAVELGSGEALPEDVSPLELEICQQHFCEFDGYGEPVIFWNKSQDCEIRLSSCRLCLKFTLPKDTILNWHDLALGEYTAKQLLKKVLKIDCDDSDSLDCSICQHCLVRLDTLSTIYGQLTNDAKEWKKMQGLSKHERRVWGKISTKNSRFSAGKKLTSSDAILCQVEMHKKEPIDADTEFTVDLQSENEEESDILPETEERGIFHLEAEEKLQERTDDEVSEHPKSGKSLAKSTDQPSKSATRETRVKPLKGKEKRKASDKPIVKKPKQRKRAGQPAMDLKNLISRKCYLCVVIFESPEELLSHLLAHKDEDLVCGDCNEHFSSLGSYNRHLARHDPTERPIKCDRCSLRYKDAKGLRTHEEFVHHIDHGMSHKKSSNDKSFTCQYCGKAFNMFHKLKTHEDTHMGYKRYKCKHCNQGCSSRMNLERHIMATHTSVKPFKCDICYSIFRKSTFYEEHRKSCNPAIVQEIIENGPPCNTCRFCSAEFDQHSDLIDHLVQRHSEEKVNFIHCTLCRHRFVEKYYYVVHLQKHQIGTRPRRRSKGATLSCHQCSKTFANAANLNRHERLHTGVKAYQCEVCGKKFVQQAQLRTHIRIHTGEKPFECESCGKRFSDRSTLYRHRKNVCTTE